MRGRQFKVCLMGDGFVGKTSIRREYLKEGFSRSYIPTLGVDFAQKELTFEGVKTKLVIWDIAGQEVYRGMRRRYYQGSSGMILVYSVVDRVSFDNASKWLVEAHEFKKKLPSVVIAANKIDLRPQYPDEETVSTEEGLVFSEKFSKKLKTPVLFLETSALTGENIEDVFEELTRMMVEGHIRGSPKPKGEVPSERLEEALHPTSIVQSSSESVDVVVSEVDPVTSLEHDSKYLEEEKIGREMSQLIALRAELKEVEEELLGTMSELEAKLLNLRNVVNVKRITYEHLKEQTRITREEWAEAYDEYVRTDELRKVELAKKSSQIKQLRENIEKLGKKIRQLVSDLDIRAMRE